MPFYKRKSLSAYKKRHKLKAAKYAFCVGVLLFLSLLGYYFLTENMTVKDFGFGAVLCLLAVNMTFFTVLRVDDQFESE